MITTASSLPKGVSKWYLVAFAMIGASISGVTFISIPGVVGKSGVNENFSYMQLVLGYLLGYLIIANVLMPVYYRMNLTSIYEYMNQRFGFFSYKTSAFFFIISKIVGASFRFFLVSLILDQFLTGPCGIPFPVTSCHIDCTYMAIYFQRGYPYCYHYRFCSDCSFSCSSGTYNNLHRKRNEPEFRRHN